VRIGGIRAANEDRKIEDRKIEDRKMREKRGRFC
jgi:hypothetical protein